jgi:Ca2+-transporting ATPase
MFSVFYFFIFFYDGPNIGIATDPPSPYVLERKPEPKSAPLITLTMWKMIVGQAIYQLVVTLVLNFAGQFIFSKWDSSYMQTVVFNTFVFMQIFNQYKQVVGLPPGRVTY